MARISIIYFDLNTGYYPSVHHGLAYIIGALRNDNHKVFLHHLIGGNDLESAVGRVREDNADLVCLSFTTNQKRYVRRFLTNSDLSEKLTVAGGVHCTLVKENVFDEFPEIHGICIGEGEVPLKDLCRRLDSNEEYLSTPSFYFKTKRGIVKNAIAPLVNIDVLSLPDYRLFNYKKIISENGDCFPMMLGRGCPYSCHYCCNHAIRRVYPNKKSYVRFPSVEHAIRIIKNNLSVYPKTRRIVFADDTFTLDKGWLFDFCEVFKKEVGLPFICNGRVETISEELVRRLKIAGCVSVDFGVESGNEWLRRFVLNRKHSNKRIRKAFRLTRKHGIKRFSFNIVGLPFETVEMAEDTLRLNMELRPDFGKCFYFFPYPGTVLHGLCSKYGFLSDKTDSVSGYLESPLLKEFFISHEEVKRVSELMNLFFCVRLVFSKTKMPLFLEKMVLKVLTIFRKPVSNLFDSTGNGKNMILLNKMKMVAKRHLR